MQSLAPIVLFVYNRPELTLKTLEALSSNRHAERSILYIYADGPKPNATEEQKKKIEEVRSIAGSRKWCKEVNIITSTENKGLAGSVITGVTAVLERHNKVIVLEDDILVSPSFLSYMNSALNYYQSSDQVASVHAYSYPVPGLPEFYFLTGADCWGWGTWKRAWQCFERDGRLLLRRLEEGGKTEGFDMDGAFSYSGMLRDQIAGKNDSWAVRWHASAYLAGMLTLYPGVSFVQNIGLDGSGTHSAAEDHFFIRRLNVKEEYHFEQIEVKESPEARHAVARWLAQHSGGNKFSRSSMKKFLSRIKSSFLNAVGREA